MSSANAEPAAPSVSATMVATSVLRMSVFIVCLLIVTDWDESQRIHATGAVTI